jgi:4-amino-4-deoxy-L-arabinose transferase-like glycosyltransferase
MAEADAANAPAAAPPEPPKPPRSRFLAWLARRPFKVLTLLCLLLWLPGILSLPALDRDESRFAESSRQMIDSGNLIDIRFGQVPRYKKPVGIYWAQAAATGIASHVYGWVGDHSHIWTYRLPSLLGGIVSAWLTFWLASSLFGAEAGLLAALLMATSILLTAEATIATTDAVLLATVLGTQGVLIRIHEGPVSRRMALAGWAAMAIGILIKGPVTPAVAAVTILVLAAWNFRQQRWQSFSWLKGAEPLRGLALLLAIVLPWLIAIAIQTHGDFFRQSLGDDFAAKVAGGQESHGAPPGYYLLLSSLSFWPAIAFIAPGIGLAITRRAEPAIRFLIAWAVGWWVLVEAVPTKLPHYVLPAYPALAILAALWLLAPKTAEPVAATAPAPEKNARDGDEAAPVVAAPKPKKDWRRWLVWLAALQFLLGLAALVAGPVELPRLYGDGGDALLFYNLHQSQLVMGLSGAAALAGLVALIMLVCGMRLGVLIPALLALFIVTPTLTVLTAPGLSQFWVSRDLAALVAKDSEQGDPPPVLAGYEEPSLVFALGADTGLSDGKGAAEIGAKGGGLALVDDAERPQFLARLAELQADATALDEVSGFNYSRGKTVHVTVYRVSSLNPVTRPTVH